jgi:DNA topoisomerase-3
MTSIVITEKPSQAGDVMKAVGGRYGEVIPAQGHVMRLAEPDEVDPAWTRWSTALLLPAAGRYPLREDPSNGKGARLAKLKPALRAAETIYCSTDCDREGTLIAGNLVNSFSRPSARVLRVVFTAQDPTTLRKAFAEARPWSDFANEMAAGEARSQADQIYNLTLTRAATVLLRQPGAKGAIGIGRVKTPTLAIVCKRELEIEAFQARDYFEVVAQASVAGGRFVMRHAAKPRLEDRAQAEAIARAAEGWSGPLTVVTEDKRQSPPRLFDLPALQKTCSARFGWTADKTLEVAQDLYQNHGHLLTYPRAESRYLAETQIGDAKTLTERLSGLYGLSAIAPVIRRGKDGVYSDKGLEGVSHHAVIPNINGDLSKLATLDADGRRLFDLVAKAYLAAHHPDHLYRQTTVTALVDGHLFRATGRITTSPGWTAIYDDRADDEGGEAAEAEQTLPPLTNGDPAQLSGAKVEAKRTKPPPRYTEGTLIQAMQESWRFIPDSRPDLRERLRDAKGIGTPATRAEVIKGLKRQDLLAAKGKLVAPTDQGMTLYKLLAEAAPRLVDPGVTALWELRLDQILLGRVTADQVIQEIAHEAEKVVAALTRRVAEGNLTLLAGSGRFGAARQARVSPRLSGQISRPPTEKQVAFLTKLSKEKAAKIPAGTLDDMARTSAMIDRLMGKGPKVKAKAPKRAAAAPRRKARADAQLQAETA